MRAILFAGVISLAPWPVMDEAALAQSSAAYPYCLMTGPAQDCAYNSMAQCLASKRGNADFCEPNNWYIGSAARGRVR